MNRFYKVSREIIDFDDFLEFWERVYNNFNLDVRDSEYYDKNIQIEKGKLHILKAHNIRQLFYGKMVKNFLKVKRLL